MFAVLAVNVILALIPAAFLIYDPTSYSAATIWLASMLGFNSGVGLMAWRRSAAPAATVPPPPPPPSDALLLVESAAAETRQALHTIAGFSELLSIRGVRDVEEARHYCGFIVEATRDLSLFAAQLYDYARFERGTLGLLEQEVDAAELITAALAASETAADRANAFIRADLTEGVELRCDAGRIRDAVTSLVAWLIETPATGTSIDVTFTRRGCGGIAITATASSATANPMPTDGLFEPLLPLDGLNGLALPIARRVALLHGGDVTVETAQGAGISASLILPASRVSWPGAARRSPSRAA